MTSALPGVKTSCAKLAISSSRLNPEFKKDIGSRFKGSSPSPLPFISYFYPAPLVRSLCLSAFNLSSVCNFLRARLSEGTCTEHGNLADSHWHFSCVNSYAEVLVGRFA